MLAKPILLLGVLMLMTTYVAASDRGDTPSYKNPPTDTMAAKDHDVTMYCQIENKGKNSLYWHCNSNNGNVDVTVGPDANTNPALPRHIIENSAAEIGQFNLVITNVTQLDTGSCSCIVDTGTGNAMEAAADLDVQDTTVSPGTPTCITDKNKTPGQAQGVFTADDQIVLTCVSDGGVPLANLHWEIFRKSSRSTTLPRGVKILSAMTTTANSITAVATYTLTNTDDGAYFQCIQSHPSFGNSPTVCDVSGPVGGATAPITVKYPPALRFVPTSLKVTPLETKQETLRCEYDANPSVLSSGPSIRFVPRDNNEKLKFNYTTAGSEAEIDLTLTQDDNGKVLECVATNELGSSVIKLKIESTGLLPTWILIIIIGGGGFVLFLIMAIICCVCFCGDDDEKDHHSVGRSRPGTLQGSEMGMSEGSEGYGNDYNEGYDDGYNNDPDMVPINEFEGGMEMKGGGYSDNVGYVDDEDINTPDNSALRTYDQVPME